MYILWSSVSTHRSQLMRDNLLISKTMCKLCVLFVRIVRVDGPLNPQTMGY